jgi:glycosyltransferase involved in cell wall biosynthesis
MHRILALVRPPSIDASSRYRVYQYADILSEKHKYNVDICPFYNDFEFIEYRNNRLSWYRIVTLYFNRIRQLLSIKEYEILWISRGVAPVETIYLIKRLKKRLKIVYEFDDAIYLNEGSFRIRRILARNWKAVPEYTRLSDAVIVGNDFLKEWAEKLNKEVHVIPTGVDVPFYKKHTKQVNKGLHPITVGWIGTISTKPNLNIVLPVLRDISKVISIKYMQIGGGKDNHKNLDYEYIEWSERDQLLWLNTIDIGIAPLYDTEFNRGKCGFKIIQYMAMGKPVIGSSVGVQSKIILDQQSGYLADSSEEWYKYLLLLSSDKNMRKKLGDYGCGIANKIYTKTEIASNLARVFDRVLNL